MPCLLLTLRDGDSYVHQLEERLYELVFGLDAPGRDLPYPATDGAGGDGPLRP